MKRIRLGLPLQEDSITGYLNSRRKAVKSSLVMSRVSLLSASGENKSDKEINRMALRNRLAMCYCLNCISRWHHYPRLDRTQRRILRISAMARHSFGHCHHCVLHLLQHILG